MTIRGKAVSVAAIAAIVSFLTTFGTVVSAGAATITSPATAFLSTLSITGVNPSGATIIGSVYDTDFGNFGAGTVENFLQTYFGGTITQIGGGNCPPCTQTGSGSNNGATYSGTASQLFGIHWGGGGPDQPFLGILFSAAITGFTISGFPHGVSFIRSFDGETVPEGGPSLSPTPLPGAVWLFGTVLAGGVGFGRWRNKRKALAGAS